MLFADINAKSVRAAGDVHFTDETRNRVDLLKIGSLFE